MKEKNKSDIKIAVIVPIYNTEKYLQDCIESLIHQSVPFDEIVLIDDGSLDESLLICKKYQVYPNIRIFANDNSGVSFTRNYGMKYCKSDYIMFLDSDDMLKPNTVKVIKEKLGQKDYDMVIYDADVKCEVKNYEFNEISYDKSGFMNENKMSGKKFLLNSFPDCYSTIVYLALYKKRFLIERNIEFREDLSYSEDMLFSLEALLGAQLIYYIPEKLYIRRLRDNSAMTSPIKAKRVYDSFSVAVNVADVILNNIQYVNEYNDKYISLVLRHYNIALFTAIGLKNLSVEIFKDIIILSINKLFLFFKNTRRIRINRSNVSNTQKALSIINNYKKIFNNMLIFSSFTEILSKMQTELQEELNVIIVNKLNMLPFKDKNAVIAIYGIGTMTDSILCLYKEKIGPIKSKIVFIKTKAEKNETYRDQPVFGISSIPIDVQVIVISSYRYKKEMKEVLKENNIKIHLLDIFANEYFEVKL